MVKHKSIVLLHSPHQLNGSQKGIQKRIRRVGVGGLNEVVHEKSNRVNIRTDDEGASVTSGFMRMLMQDERQGDNDALHSDNIKATSPYTS